MTWTIKDAIDVARDHLQDSRALSGIGEYRHSDEKLMRFFNIAMSDARKLRPDLFLPDIPTAADVQYTVVDLGDPSALPLPIDPTPFPIDSMYFSPVAEYIAGIVGFGDDEFAVDGRAVALLNRFSQKLIGKGA